MKMTLFAAALLAAAALPANGQESVNPVACLWDIPRGCPQLQWDGSQEALQEAARQKLPTELIGGSLGKPKPVETAEAQ